MIRIPQQLADAAGEDDHPERLQWLAALPQTVREVATEWQLELGEPYLPGGQCAWVAPARTQDGADRVLKVGWRHREAEHEAEALRFWDGDGAVRCFASRCTEHSTALLLERCIPGVPLKRCLAEPEQDDVVASLLRRLWARQLSDEHPFRSLDSTWKDEAPSTDAGLARAGAEAIRELSRTADRAVLLATDLHAENILAAEREPWLVIDPKPFIGDPAFDPVQHMLNCEQRLATDPDGLAQRMAALCELETDRVRLWLFARCVQESRHRPDLAIVARRLTSR
jgi:streptomycin 6-kinase